MGVDISVILATRDRAALLQDALACLADQETHGRFTYEVLVADNGSSDGTRDVVKGMAKAFPVALRYLHEPKVGKPWAVNAGMRAARGAFFALTDDDVRVEPGWLSALWSCFRDTQADAVGGKILPRWIGERPAWLASDEAVRPFVFGALGCVDHGERRLTSRYRRAYYWVGGNLALRREMVEQIGGLHVWMTRAQDSAYQQRCLQHGKTVVYEPGAVAYHVIGPERLTPVYFRMWWTRRGYYRAFRTYWRVYHLVTVMPVHRYWDPVRFGARWLAKTISRRPFGERLWCELRLREWGAEWRQRATLLPAMWRLAMAKGARVFRHEPRYLDLERWGWVPKLVPDG